MYFESKPRSHSDTPHTVSLSWTSDRPVVETFTWQHTNSQGTGFHAPWQYKNPQSQKESGPRDTERKFGWKIFRHPSSPPIMVDRQKNLYSKSERLTLSCRMTCVSSERFNLYNRRRHLGLGPPTGLPGKASVIWIGTAALDIAATGIGYTLTRRL
jgi:hypothetical protein